MKMSYTLNYINSDKVRQDDIYLLPISKKEVVNCDLKRMIENFKSLERTGKRGKGTVVLFFEGYDNDPREVYEIKECRLYAKQLIVAVPWAFYYLMFDPTALFPFLLCLSDTGEGIEKDIVELIDESIEYYADLIGDNEIPNVKELILRSTSS